MPYLETVQELLEAKEGEHVQFKEEESAWPKASGFWRKVRPLQVSRELRCCLLYTSRCV